MGEAAVTALQNIATPEYLGWLLLGVAVGIVIGIIPGLGGVIGMSVLLPFVIQMDPVPGIFLLVGMMAVTQTSDSFPAVLFGVPGTVSAQATIMDGYPLAKRGQGARALSAAFSSSMIGGIFGAGVLFLAIPIAKPLVLSLGSPELLMLGLLGLTTVGVVARGAPLLGLLGGVIGVALASVGTAQTAFQHRYTFGLTDLYGGISLVVLALGLFAIPELAALLRMGRPVADVSINEPGGLRRGIRDSWKNIGLILRSSALGAGVGMIPGVGGAVIDWIAYAAASKSKKNERPFGEGEIRGVIAPEAANNAKEGGGLVPTLLFGLPGSATTAIMLSALIFLGIQPGPRMVEGPGLAILLSIVWALVLANVVATGVCLGLTRWMSKLVTFSPRALMAFIIPILVMAIYQERMSWTDVIMLLLLGAMGWVLYSIGAPRAPILIGFVLGPSIERALWISVSRYEWEWLTFPGVLIIGAIILMVLTGGTWSRGGKALVAKVGNKRPRASATTSGSDS
jgi:TctA family transporter